MAFDGYLIKIGQYDTFFHKYMIYNSYSVSREVQDIDDYRDGNGILHRNVLEHESFVIEFTLRSMTNIEFQQVMTAIRSNFIVPKERKVNITFFVPELNEYRTQEAYIPTPKTPIKKISGPILYYSPITLKFIGY